MWCNGILIAGQKLPTLRTERLVLRPFEISDGARVKELAGNPKISETTAHIPYPYEEGMAEKWIITHPTEFAKGNGLTLAITLLNGALIGAIALNTSPRDHKAEIGYWIGVPYWNQGYCTEAVRGMIHYGFNVLNYHKITARYLAGNPASGRVMEKAGMKKEGELADDVCRNGKFHAVAVYGLLSSS
ncbi:MAG: GNAT family N-acetyltransferase [Chthoniobacterales bacterium]